MSFFIFKCFEIIVCPTDLQSFVLFCLGLLNFFIVALFYLFRVTLLYFMCRFFLYWFDLGESYGDRKQ